MKDSFRADMKEGKGELVLILHNIRSSHNVGSIFRTADAAGVGILYLCGITPSPIDRFGMKRMSLAKVALGAEESIEWEEVKDIKKCLNNLKEEGFHIVALEQHPTSTERIETKRDEKIALVVGNEVQGLSDEVIEMTDSVMEIPMQGKKESLNVAVATGIALFELAKR